MKDKEDFHVYSLSGGKDSTAMVIGAIKRKMKIDKIIFFDTGVEFPETYKHLQKLNDFIKKEIGLGITTLKRDHDFEYYLLKHKKTRGKNKGQMGYSFPDFRNRWCTQILKKAVMVKFRKQYRDKNFIEYHGIALDEAERALKNPEKNIKYPLIEWGMTEEDCLNYCYSLGYDWDGLYRRFDRVSCWCCPLSRVKEFRTLYKEYPQLWAKLRKWQSKTYRNFTSYYNVEQLNDKFKLEENKEGLK